MLRINKSERAFNPRDLKSEQGRKSRPDHKEDRPRSFSLLKDYMRPTLTTNSKMLISDFVMD